MILSFRRHSQRDSPLTDNLTDPLGQLALLPGQDVDCWRKESEVTEAVVQGDWVEGGATVEAESMRRLAGVVGRLEVQVPK